MCEILHDAGTVIRANRSEMRVSLACHVAYHLETQQILPWRS